MNLMKNILHSKLPELCISKSCVSAYVLCTTRWSARSRERRRLRRSIEHEAGGVAEGITAVDCGEEGGREILRIYSLLTRHYSNRSNFH